MNTGFEIHPNFEKIKFEINKRILKLIALSF